jgi:hypothetical protein
MKLIRESACDPELLRTLFLFEHLSDGQLASSMLDRLGLTALIVVHDGVGQMHADPQGDEDQ